MKYKFILSVIFITAFVISCGSTNAPKGNSAEEIFNYGLELFKDEDYVEAKTQFELIKLQYPASQFADDAQFYLGELSFERGEYILAAFHYNMLRRVYPGSTYSKDALFKTSMSNYNMSPAYDRDQEYTKKAIESFQEFQYLYPDDSLYSETSKKIMELRNKLAYREFFTAELYRKLESPRSSIIYYDAVINNYSDTDYYEKAFLGKIDALVYMKKKVEAQSILNAYKTNFPNSTKIPELEKSINDIK